MIRTGYRDSDGLVHSQLCTFMRERPSVTPCVFSEAAYGFTTEGVRVKLPDERCPLCLEIEAEREAA